MPGLAAPQEFRNAVPHTHQLKIEPEQVLFKRLVVGMMSSVPQQVHHQRIVPIQRLPQSVQRLVSDLRGLRFSEKIAGPEKTQLVGIGHLLGVLPIRSRAQDQEARVSEPVNKHD